MELFSELKKSIIISSKFSLTTVMEYTIPKATMFPKSSRIHYFCKKSKLRQNKKNKNLLKKCYLIILLTAFILGCKDKETTSNTDLKTNNNDVEINNDLEVKASNLSKNDKSLICL